MKYSLPDVIVKRFISGLILIVTVNVFSFGQPVFEDKQKETVIGNGIESVTTWDYYYTNNKLDKTGQRTSYTKFDKKGNIIETITYKSRDTLAHETFKYNREGKRTDYMKKKGLKIAYQKSSTYDNDGNLTLEAGFDGSSPFRNEYDYENNGKLKQIRYYLDNHLKEKRDFKNDGNLTEIAVYNSSNSVISYLSLKYDDNGNVVEEITYNLEKVPLEKKLYVYNSNNKVISEVKYRGDAFYYKLTYLYNSQNDLTNIDEENPNERRFLKKQFTYDPKGNLLEMTWRRNSKEAFSSRTYTYDEKNNCTQYETFYPGTNFKVLTKLTYDTY